MTHTRSRVRATTRRCIHQVLAMLDYAALAPIYCDEGGEAFWEDRRGPCERLGIKVATVLKNMLLPGGRSLYVGAGVAELPPILMETLELHRQVEAYNLRDTEVAVLNRALQPTPVSITAGDARSALGMFDHLWMVSVLNDPERFPTVSALSYGRADPVAFDAARFCQEREAVFALTAACLEKVSQPGLITTSVEEIPWIAHWCEQHALSYLVGKADYPTAIVGDPICFIWIHASPPAEQQLVNTRPVT